MKRYQMYLEPTAVKIVDTIAEAHKVSRSDIIRDVLEQLSIRYLQTMPITPPSGSENIIKPDPWDNVIGALKNDCKGISLNVDEIYGED